VTSSSVSFVYHAANTESLEGYCSAVAPRLLRYEMAYLEATLGDFP
jgi:hypothetical protein